jgi:hypothetical protein
MGKAKCPKICLSAIGPLDCQALSGSCTKIQLQIFCNVETIFLICNSLFCKGQHPSPPSAALVVKSGLVWKMGLVESKGQPAGTLAISRSQQAGTFSSPGANQLVLYRVQGRTSWYIFESRGKLAGTFSGLYLSMFVIKSPIQLVRQSP